MFLGDKYNPNFCNGGDAKVLESFRQFNTSEQFYRETEIYCYHGRAFFLEGIKRPYYAQLLNMTINARPLTILDYGCGSGDDGIFFTQAGFYVGFADIPSRSLEFTRWKLRRKLLPLPIYELGVDEIDEHYSIVWCMDVLEHIQPEKHTDFIRELKRYGDVVMMNFVSDPKADGELHHPVDSPALTEFIRENYDCETMDYYDGRVRLAVFKDKPNA